VACVVVQDQLSAKMRRRPSLIEMQEANWLEAETASESGSESQSDLSDHDLSDQSDLSDQWGQSGHAPQGFGSDLSTAEESDDDSSDGEDYQLHMQGRRQQQAKAEQQRAQQHHRHRQQLQQQQQQQQQQQEEEQQPAGLSNRKQYYVSLWAVAQLRQQGQVTERERTKLKEAILDDDSRVMAALEVWAMDSDLDDFVDTMRRIAKRVAMQ
jgi:glucan-binding YG repeat protein